MKREEVMRKIDLATMEVQTLVKISYEIKHQFDECRYVNAYDACVFELKIISTFGSSVVESAYNVNSVDEAIDEIIGYWWTESDQIISENEFASKVKKMIQ